MVTGAESSRDVVTSDQSEPKPVSCRLMLLRVVLEVIPQVVSKRIFIRYVKIEDAGKLRTFGGKFGKFKCTSRLEPDEENALPVLRYHAPCIDYFPIDLIAEGVRQRVMDDLKRAPLVVPDEVLDILQNKRRRLVVIEDVRDGEEKVSLLLVLKTVLAAEAILFGYACEAERLARKTAAKDVELGYFGDSHGMNVTVRRLAKVGGIGLLAEFVPVAGEDAFRTRAFEGDAEPADPAKEVDESKSAVVR